MEDLFADSRLRKLPKGQIVIYEGDSVDHLYYIVNGFIKVYNILSNGSERTIFIYGPDDLFPFTSYLSGSGVARYFYESIAETEVYSISPKRLEQKVRGNFEIGEALIQYSNSVSQQFIQRIDILSVNDARRKIIALLAFLATKTGNDGDISTLSIPLTTQDIANMCGLTRETVSIQLARLRRAGIVSGGRSLVIDTVKLNKLKPALAIHT